MVYGYTWIKIHFLLEFEKNKINNNIGSMRTYRNSLKWLQLAKYLKVGYYFLSRARLSKKHSSSRVNLSQKKLFIKSRIEHADRMVWAVNRKLCILKRTFECRNAKIMESAICLSSKAKLGVWSEGLESQLTKGYWQNWESLSLSKKGNKVKFNNFEGKYQLSKTSKY